MSDLCEALHPQNPEWTCTKPKPCARQHVYAVRDAFGAPQIKAAWPNAAEPPGAKPDPKRTAKMTGMAQRAKPATRVDS